MEPYLDGVHCLSHILGLTNLASYQIDQIVEFASDSLWYYVRVFGGRAFYDSTVVQFRRVSAIGVVAYFGGIDHCGSGIAHSQGV